MTIITCNSELHSQRLVGNLLSTLGQLPNYEHILYIRHSKLAEEHLKRARNFEPFINRIYSQWLKNNKKFMESLEEIGVHIHGTLVFKIFSLIFSSI